MNQRGNLKLVWSVPDNFDTSDQDCAMVVQPKDALASWVGKQRKRGTVTREKQSNIEEELDHMLETNSWALAKPIHVVTLYMLLHETVYGVAAMELRNIPSRQAASRMVLNLVKRDFHNKMEDLVDFVRWTWEREESREEWRRRNNAGRRRITWRMQFGGELLTEYLMQRLQNG